MTTETLLYIVGATWTLLGLACVPSLCRALEDRNLSRKQSILAFVVLGPAIWFVGVVISVIYCFSKIIDLFENKFNLTPQNKK